MADLCFYVVRSHEELIGSCDSAIHIAGFSAASPSSCLPYPRRYFFLLSSRVVLEYEDLCTSAYYLKSRRHLATAYEATCQTSIEQWWLLLKLSWNEICVHTTSTNEMPYKYYYHVTPVIIVIILTFNSFQIHTPDNIASLFSTSDNLTEPMEINGIYLYQTQIIDTVERKRP